VIEAATFDHQNVTELWQRIREQASALGYDSPGIGATDVNWLRSQAVGSRNARNTLAGLGPENYIGPDAIHVAPYARDLATRIALPRYIVRFEHIVIRDGEQVIEGRPAVYTSSMPRSKRELELSLAQDAAGLADSYGVQNVGIGDYSITEI
jgi:hypothetical protein